MNFAFQQRVQHRLSQEIGTTYKTAPRFRVGLVYPNHYFFGMSNLGFHTLYRIFNQDAEVSCERMFLPEEDLLDSISAGSLQTYEQRSSGSDLNLIAFSISYQNDYLNLIPLLTQMGLEYRAERRSDSDPLVIAGGPAVTINPLPIARLVDAAVIGEGEEVAVSILEIIKSDSSKAEKLAALNRLEGVYVPSLFTPHFNKTEKASGGFGLVSGTPNGKANDQRFIRRLVVKNPEIRLSQTEVLAEDTEFGDMFLIEVQRGCQWGCRFCAAGFMYRYPRYDMLEGLKRRIDVGLQHRRKVGLIAGDLLGHESIHEILEYIDQKGGGFSPSSVRLNAFTPEIIRYLQKSGNRTIAIAPEAGSERLRRALNKTFTQEEIVASALQLAEGGIHNIKLYIMIGLPTEDEDDIEELCGLTVEVRRALLGFAKKSGRIPNLTLSVSPFVPKPSTPLQYKGFAGVDVLKKKIQKIRQRLLPQGNIHLSGEGTQDAWVETLLSRGPEQTMEFLEKALVPAGKSLKVGSASQLRRAAQGLSFDPEDYVSKVFNAEEACPWDFVDHGVKNSFYLREFEKFAAQKITHYCMPEVCRSCGVC